MSRQSKNRKNRERAKEFSLMHKRGEKGPKATQPKHNKSLEKRAYSRLRRGMKDKVLEKKAIKSIVDVVVETAE